MKLTHDKFRFHVTTIELSGETITVGGNNYNTILKMTYNQGADIKKINSGIIDFLLQICEDLHHRVIVPAKSLLLNFNKNGGQLDMDLIGTSLHYSFPERAVMMCPVKNTGIDDLCSYVAESLSDKIKEKTNFQIQIDKIKVKVSQNVGPRIATVKLRFN
jgi:hypothetical protein